MTPEQDGLLRMAEESLAAARLLHAQSMHRFAVSRAYYSMFYCAEALLLEKGMAFSKHAGVIAAFGKEFVKTGELPESLHRFIIEASEVREDGDYDYAADINEQDSGEQIARAEEFIQATRARLGM
jgi:uncharacterized protein (UPF0332 family)